MKRTGRHDAAEPDRSSARTEDADQFESFGQELDAEAGLTGLAMLVALLANMALLPVRLVVLRAAGPAAPDEPATPG